MSETLPSERPAVSRKKQSIINVVASYVSVLLTITQGIVLTPLCLKYIPPSLYGAWLASGNILVWINMVDPGIFRILQQRVAFLYGRGEMARLGGVIGTGLFLGILFSIVPLALIPFSGRIMSWLGPAEVELAELTLAFQWALVSSSLMIALAQPYAANLGLQRSVGAGVSYSVSTFFGIVATYVMLKTGYRLLSIPVGLTVRAALLLISNYAWMLHWCLRNLPAGLTIRRDELLNYSALSSLTFIERIVSSMLTQSDVILASKYQSNSAAVVFVMTGRACEPVRLVADRLLPAFFPGISHLAGEGKRERLQEISNRLMGVIAFMISVGMACVVALNFAFVRLWIGSDYFGGQRLTILFACLTVINVVFSCLQETTFAVGGVGPIEVMRIVESVVRIVLQVALLKWVGIIGIPLGGCIGMILVSGYYLPGLAARILGMDARQQYRLVAKHFLRSGVLMACGIAIWYGLSLLHIEWTWVGFFEWGAVVGAVLTSIGLALSPSMRAELRGFVTILRARHRRS